MEQEELLKKHFKKTLSHVEEKEFYALLQNDANFKTLFEEYIDFNSAFKANDAKQLKDYLKTIELNEIKTPIWYKKSWLYYGAAILIIALSIPFIVKQSTNSLYNTYFETYPNVEQPIIRGVETNNINEAFQAYENNNFDKAIFAFEAILKSEENPNYRFYYAMSLLNSKKYDLALIELSKLEKIKFSYHDESLWYMALLHIKNGENDLAKSKLSALENSKSMFKSKAVKQLLKELD